MSLVIISQDFRAFENALVIHSEWCGKTDWFECVRTLENFEKKHWAETGLWSLRENFSAGSL